MIYFGFFKKTSEKVKERNNIQEKPSDNGEANRQTDDDENNGQYELTIYQHYNGNLSIDKREDLNPAFTINVSSPDAKALAIDDESLFVLYSDSILYLYNVKTKSSQKLNLSSQYKAYKIFLNENQNKVIGVGYLKENSEIGYYNILIDKKMYDGRYKIALEQDIETNENIYAIGYDMYSINDTHFVVDTAKGMYILSNQEEKEKLHYTYSTDEDGSLIWYHSEKSNNKYIYTLEFCITEYCGITKIYNDGFKEFYSGEVNRMMFSFHNGIVYLNEKENIKKYNPNGELISVSKEYGEIKHIDNNYVTYLKNDKIILENIDNGEEVKEIVKLEKGWSYDEFESGYYTREKLDSMEEKSKKEGLYIVVTYGYNDNGAIKDANGNYGMEYCYTSDKKIIEYPITEEVGGRAKPVLYLYPVNILACLSQLN